MLYVYACIAAVAVPLLDKYFPIFGQKYTLLYVLGLFLGIFLALVILQVLVFFVSVFLVDMKKPPKNTRYMRAISESTLSLLFSLLRVKIVGENVDKIPENSRFVLISNHTHTFDPAVIMVALKGAEIAFIGKTEIITEMPIVAKLMYSLGSIFVDRDNVGSAARSAVAAVKQLKSDTSSIGIFPEGHRSPDGQLHEFKAGGFKIAQKANVPIVVLKLSGVRDMLKMLFIVPKTATAKVLRVITPDEYKDMSADRLSEICKTEIENDG